MSKTKTTKPILQHITSILELINNNQVLADKLTNQEFFKQHYIIIVLNIMFDGVDKELTTINHPQEADLFLQDTIKYLEKQIIKLNQLVQKDNPKKLEKKVNKVIDKVGFMVELARLKLFKPCELDELIRDIYKQKVISDVTKKTTKTKSSKQSKSKPKTTKKTTNKSKKK